MAARFRMTAGALLRTAFSLTVLHLPATLLMAVMNAVPVIMLLFAPAVFLRWLPLWTCLWFALIAYLNGKLLLKLWEKHLPKQEHENAAE